MGGGDVGDFLKNFVTADDLTKRGVLLVEEAGIAVADKKLATGGIGAGGAGHREDAAHVSLGVEFGLHFVTGIAGAGHAARTLFGVGATALDHETLDDAVKCGAVVKFVVGELFEVFDRLGGDVGPEGDGHFAVGSLDDGLFDGSAHGKRASKPPPVA